MDELKRIAELLRPLWPGIMVQVVGSRLMGSTGRVHIDVFLDKGLGWLTDDGSPSTDYPWTCAVRVGGEEYRATWAAPEGAAGVLRAQRDTLEGRIVPMREALADLIAALGLEWPMVSIPAFPGLLRPGSTAVFAPHIRNMYGGKDGGVVFMAGNVAALVTYLEDCRPALIPLGELSLDLNETGRLHARMWLGEQGHATQEDRAEVLAWSVESVRRGGPLTPMVAGKWRDEEDGSWARYYLDITPTDSQPGIPAGCVWPEKGGWRTWEPDVEVIMVDADFRRPHGPDLGEAGKSACDAALLARGWALTNDDGSLTLPPLPEVADVAR